MLTGKLRGKMVSRFVPSQCQTGQITLRHVAFVGKKCDIKALFFCKIARKKQIFDEGCFLGKWGGLVGASLGCIGALIQIFKNFTWFSRELWFHFGVCFFFWFTNSTKYCTNLECQGAV